MEQDAVKTEPVVPVLQAPSPPQNEDTSNEDSSIADISNAAHSASQPVPEAVESQSQFLQSDAAVPPAQPVASAPTTLDDFINTQLSQEEKRKLRFDLLSLPPEKLGEIIFILQKSQPHNIEQKGDELEIDLKKLNTKTLRHLQRYVESVFAKVRYNSMSPMNPMANPMMAAPNQINPGGINTLNALNPWHAHQQKRLSVGDLIPNRKRTIHNVYGVNGTADLGRLHGLGVNQRKKRSAFTTQQKESMVSFWQNVNWQPVPNDEELEAAGKAMDVTVAQLKVFRQNNRKKYTESPMSAQMQSHNTENLGDDGNTGEVIKQMEQAQYQKNVNAESPM